VIAAAWGQFRNPEEEEHLPLKVVTREMVKLQLTEKI
jgi:hypothetical protein